MSSLSLSFNLMELGVTEFPSESVMLLTVNVKIVLCGMEAIKRRYVLPPVLVISSGPPEVAKLIAGLQLQPGNWVVAYGHPWGVDGAATAGVVIGQGPTLPERPRFGRDWLAVSLHYRPGHSGGPLVDAEGRLVGINTVMAGPDVGLAVPVHVIKSFLKVRLGRESSQ